MLGSGSKMADTYYELADAAALYSLVGPAASKSEFEDRKSVV